MGFFKGAQCHPYSRDSDQGGNRTDSCKRDKRGLSTGREEVDEELATTWVEIQLEKSAQNFDNEWQVNLFGLNTSSSFFTFSQVFGATVF